MNVHTYSDGGISPGPSYGFVIKDPNGAILHQYGHRLPEGVTSNEAEWCGLLAALYKARDIGAKRVTAFGDSQLVIRQASGQYAVRAEHLIEFHEELRELVKAFDQVLFRWIPRDQNTLADALGRGAYED